MNTNNKYNKTIKIAITGAAGNIAYSLIFRLASGEIFGKNTEIILSLIDLPICLQKLKGIVMELEDCAYPLLKQINYSDNISIGFQDSDWIILLGSAPRKLGMERKDLLSINAQIFKEQGHAIDQHAKKTVKTLVVGNPCNTNCYIAMNNAPSIPKTNWFAMTKLDENRAKFQISKKLNISINSINNMIIWGNHSATQYPDFFNAKINNKYVTDYNISKDYIINNLINTIQQRGSDIIKHRGLSSAASAASAIIDTIKALIFPTKKGETHSIGVCCLNSPYGIKNGFIVSLPIISDGHNWNIKSNITLNNISKKYIDISINEIYEEAKIVKNFINNY